MSLVKKLFVPNSLKSPPNRLDIIIVIGNIRVFHISPKANTVTHFLPLALIGKYAVFALFNKVFNTIIFNLRLATYTKLLFYLKLNRQTMSVPARFALHAVSLHCSVTGDKVLDNTSQNVSDMRLTVCSRGTVKKSKNLAAIAVFDTLFKYIVFFPKINDRFFSVHKGQIS